MSSVQIPKHVSAVIRGLRRHGFQAFVVGGAVRDLLLRRVPRDWDVATNAKPDDIEGIFRKTLPLGKKFGTITVFVGKKQIQVTTFRGEKGYTDRRRPSSVKFGVSLEEDLSRRDFTINAMALDPLLKKIIDPFGGRKDLRKNLLQTVGDAGERLAEDTLRAIRAGRFIGELGLRPASRLTQASAKVASHIRGLSAERIRDELIKLMDAPKPSQGLIWFDRTGILKEILPELVRCKGVEQKGWHRYDVFRHTLRAVDASSREQRVRWAALLHDLGKPETRTCEGRSFHFYGHEKTGVKYSERILRRLRFPKEFIQEVSALVLHHLFVEEQVTASAAAFRRFLRRVGEERVIPLVELRLADVKGTGPNRRPHAALARVEKMFSAFQKERSALSRTDLKVTGVDLMRWMGAKPGPEIGRMLEYLLQKVLQNPSINRRILLRKEVLRAQKMMPR